MKTTLKTALKLCFDSAMKLCSRCFERKISAAKSHLATRTG